MTTKTTTIRERMAPGHLYQPRLGSGIEWLESPHYAGVISVMPHGCMPGGIVAAMAEKFNNWQVSRAIGENRTTLQRITTEFPGSNQVVRKVKADLTRELSSAGARSGRLR